MLVFAALTPNSPLLFPSINLDRIDEVEKTILAMKELSEDLYAARPDTIVVFSESITMYPDAFSLNVSDPYIASLSDVGDLGYQKKYHPDLALIDAVQRFARKNDLPVSLSTDQELNFASAIPLHFLTEHLPDSRVMPIAPATLDQKAHFDFGSAIKSLILDSSRRIAVIAAGDMSHALTTDSPAGFHADGLAFEEKILSVISERSTSGLLQLDPTVLENAKDTSHRQIAMLFGVLDGVAATPSILSYEKPFGVGYCVTNFIL